MVRSEMESSGLGLKNQVRIRSKSVLVDLLHKARVSDIGIEKCSHRYAVRKNYVIIWEFFPNRGGGLLNSQNFCKLTKCFLCQIHSEVLKHVLHTEEGNI